MQELRNIPADYRLTNYVKPFYEMFSDKRYPVNLKVDRRLGSILSLVNIKAGKRPIEVLHDTKLEATLKTPANVDNRKIFVAFSGGKDCLATAIKAKQKGFEPTLVYIGGVNKSLPSEHVCAVATAKATGFPLIELKLHIAGTKEYGDHPIKNILLLSMIVDEGLKHGCINFSMGNLFEETADRGSLDFDFSDSWEMLRTFARLLAAYIPGAKLHAFIHDNLQSFHTVFRFNKAALSTLSTCITPDFRRPMIQKANRAKYGAQFVPDFRCGNCYKCADEYRFMSAFGVRPFNQKFMNHCKEANAKFDKNYPTDFVDTTPGVNRFGGKNTTDIQVLSDRCGFYIGKLLYDGGLNKFFVDEFYGNHHYKTRAEAEAILARYKSILKL
jgi:hypothetical protein